MKTKRNVYLKMKPLSEAREIVFQAFNELTLKSGESVTVPDAVGRILAEPVTARLSSPSFHAAAMDGIAVKAQDTYGASETRPRELLIGKNAFYLNTGHVMPPDTDAVIMIEHVNELDDSKVSIENPAFPWQYVRRMGEDIVATELLFARNHKVTPYCIGALLSGGIYEVSVRCKPKALILPTGSELVDWRQTDPQELAPGQVIEGNSYVLGKLVEACGGRFERHRMLADNLESIQAAVHKAVYGDFDCVMIIGGSSAGSEDYSRPVISRLGEVLVHGVTMMPGKPVIIGKVAGKAVFGIPGYPVSAIMAFEQFVRPLIYQLLGQPDTERSTCMVEPTRKIPSKLGVEEFLRVKLGQVGQRVVATPLPRGAGSITSITEADGIIRIPNHVEGIENQAPVAAELLRPLATIRNTVVVVGSHDNSLDVLADELRATHTGMTLSSSHVGSMGGLMAIKRGVCHLAGAHLLDTETGSYNTSYIKRYLPEMAANGQIRLVNLVFREQGLILPSGNPKGIRGLADLRRGDIRLINRQSGSGTRILLDYRLQQLDIDPTSIQGYENEEFTHMAVAVAVLSGSVDVGLGIYAAAKALNLDFVPIVTEQYDLVIPQVYFNSDNIRMLMDTIRSPGFKQRVARLGGYETENTGQVWL